MHVACTWHINRVENKEIELKRGQCSSCALPDEMLQVNRQLRRATHIKSRTGLVTSWLAPMQLNAVDLAAINLAEMPLRFCIESDVRRYIHIPGAEMVAEAIHLYPIRWRRLAHI